MAEYTIDPTDVEVKLGIDDLQPNELNIAYRRGYQEGRLSVRELYEALKLVKLYLEGEVLLFNGNTITLNDYKEIARKALAKVEGKDE